ncbi:MAG: aspartate-semialdehyde dehydrogenase [Clostridium sp.]|jgi:aspartate-semialdehyde dehydrogenase|uniref:aspartate-semialdehyde dehydrogenase n=1 Tax=Clostridium sp. TaxID=1506 RepID=UPI0025C4C30A|nr:aspartate-semialdehyde dehydrogenase [Clostridium sp.]MCH3962811.1 aspartate-semialdehyde dehydrogenase [Clostridium sp.]MCI1715774.1 aspartate-semialdehyde dehydrogenase [Clostridium sp.]MCI1800021.1 aspartate-semialdehyde dehydrogenase [Clostridium sp.]MCI1813935.1 aspartate-semialdehyde dehydrogenase [Clostridium sp.]MCI1870833.1 aspartate-semialdehyde dehydrogenase [Clostridium sp.]
MKSNVAVVGCTGMVGRTFIKVLEERNFPIENLYLYASSRSEGKVIKFKDKNFTVEELKEDNIKNKKIDIALFSAGASVSKEYAPIFARYGATVVDNSSCWRMDKDIPLVVPEVNPEDIKWNKGIIANPNCSTIQAMLPLKALYDKYGIKRIIYSTYQAVSGAGLGGYNDLLNGYKNEPPKKFPYPIAGNILPHIDVFLDNGYTKEEEKMINETRKILHDDNLKITATTARVPVFYGHSESINVELKSQFEVDDIFELFRNIEGLILKDDVKNLVYPMPIDAEGHDEVFVGRIRRDFSIENGLNIWVVADNIRKGAASNAVEIAECIINGK